MRRAGTDQLVLLDRDRDVFFDRERDRLRGGTFAPFFRASLKPIAIACFRLLTVRPERPLFSEPRLRRRIADSTVFCARFPYFAMVFLWRNTVQSTYLSQH